MLAVSAAALPLLLALSPAWLPPGVRAAVMDGLAPLCHQLPARSPHLHGVPLGLCWRCIGLAAGLPLGVALWTTVQVGWRVYGRSWAVVAGVVLGADWLLGALGWWPSPAWARLLTGCLFGGVLGLALGQALLERRTPAASPAG